MADDNERAGEALQPFLEPLDRPKVEMVGGLVEQQDVGLLRQRAGYRRPTPLAAACGRGRPPKVDPELAGNRRRLVRLWGIASLQHPFLQRREPVHLRVLLEEHDVGPRYDRALALIRVDHVREAFEQRSLAGAVPADQRQPVALTNVEIEMAEQPAFPLDQSQVFVTQDRRCHARH